MLDKRTFEKGMNNDAAIELVSQGEYSYALNVSVYNDGFQHVILGNTEVTVYDVPFNPNNSYTVIGSRENLTNNCVYYFVYGTNKDNRILKFDRANLKVITLMLEPTIPILNFSLNNLITSIVFEYLDKDNMMIYWCDGVASDSNPPRKINERRALGYMNRWVFSDNFFSAGAVGFTSTIALPTTGVYGFKVGDKIKIVQDAGFDAQTASYNNYATIVSITGNNIVTDIPFSVSTLPQSGYIVHDWAYSVIEEQTIDRVKWQPMFAPVVAGKHDLTYQRNNIQNNLLQFCARYIYDDFETTTISSYSPVVLNDEGHFNAIDIVVNSGAANVRKFEICVRSKTSDIGVEVYNDTYIVKTFDKDKEAILDNSDYTFTYYNDVILTPLSSSVPTSNVQVLQSFDNVPLKCGASSAISGNRITDGNIVEQFDLVKPDVTLSLVPTSFKTIALTQNAYGTSFGSSGVTQIINSSTGGIIQVTSFKTATNLYLPQSVYFNPNNIIGNTASISFSTDATITLPAAVPTLPVSFEMVFSDGTSQTIPFSASDISYYPFQPLNNIASWLNIRGYAALYDPTDPYKLIVPQKVSGVSPNITVTALTSAKLVSKSLETAILAFKNGATHCFGIEYSDRAGRLCTVIKDDNMSKFIPFTTIVPQYGTYSYFQMNINHVPPEWATHYRILYTKNTSEKTFFQTEAATNTSTVNKTIYINISFAFGFGISYSYTKGDRVKIIKFSGNFVNNPQVVDLPIESYNATTFEIKCSTQTPLSLHKGDLIEVYTPMLSTTQQIYYELGGKEYTILNPHTTIRSHHGQSQDQVVNANGVSIQPAIVFLERGDTYFRQRIFTNAGYNSVEIIEDANYSDSYPSAVTDCGRPNVVDANFREVIRPTTIYYSGQLIAETSINGLSTVPAGNFRTCSLLNGQIMRMIMKDYYLKVFQYRKIISVPINQTLQQTPTGTVTVYNDIVLNDERPHAGDFGLSHPESLSTYGFADYGIDVNRGIIWRDSNDGLTPISKLYKLNSFMSDISSRINNFNGVVRAYGVFNKRRNQYEICFASQPGFIGAVAAFNEKENAFQGFYSYDNEGMCSSNQDFVIFNGGKIWLQNSNPIACNFCGVQYYPEIWVASNQDFSAVKVFEAMTVEAEKKWSLIGIQNSAGQDTTVDESQFETIEGIHYAALNFDTNTQNVVDPLFNGDNIRDVATLFKFQNKDNVESKIKLISIQYIKSDRSGV